uniref:Uncharacterized protein n=1 Tax=Anguilla anguilla TaxID=7936 RepID=A0A0E9VCJ9_ANGAN
MMQKVRVLVSAFFCLYGLFHFLFQLSLAVLFYCAISLSFSITYT